VIDGLPGAKETKETREIKEITRRSKEKRTDGRGGCQVLTGDKGG
jgi:hypothetical protein